MKTSKPFTVRVGRTGFNGEVLAAGSLTDAYKTYPKHRKELVKQAYEEACRIAKEQKASEAKVAPEEK